MEIGTRVETARYGYGVVVLDAECLCNKDEVLVKFDVCFRVCEINNDKYARQVCRYIEIINKAEIINCGREDR